MNEFNDDVNFEALEKEMNSAIAQDNKYQRQNDAKFRAIHQKVQSYDEFRDIVEASHLTPLSKEDKIGGMSYQKWNSVSSKGSADLKPELPACVVSKAIQNQPRNGQEFVRVWKRKSPQHRFQYLLSIDEAILKKCFASDCLLGEIASVIYLCSTEINFNIKKIIQILEVVSETKRFCLELDFLNKEQSFHLQEIFKALRESTLEDEKLVSIVDALHVAFKVDK